MADQHRHSNPSPSHDVGAWCNGTGYGTPDQGCGQFVPLSSFRDLRQDESPRASYLGDLRWALSVVEPLLGLSLDQDYQGAVTIEIPAARYRSLAAWRKSAKTQIENWEAQGRHPATKEER